MQIEPGEAPLEWRGDGAVVLPEGEEPGLELGERGEVVGVEHLALDDREEPAGPTLADRPVNRLRTALAEAGVCRPEGIRADEPIPAICRVVGRAHDVPAVVDDASANKSPLSVATPCEEHDRALS